MRPLLRNLASSLLVAGLVAVASAAPATKPLKILLITGGCCHDYAAQKDLLKAGLEKRINVVVDHLHTPDKSTKPPLECLTNPGYAKGYDLVIHDECAAAADDPAQVANVLKPHVDGTPGVACLFPHARTFRDVSYQDWTDFSTRAAELTRELAANARPV